MTAETAGEVPAAGPYELIHLGGEAAAIVPLSDLRRLRALERIASPQELEDAEIAATSEDYREWTAAGRPGALPHAEVRRMLLGHDAG
jgi:hypothetical protein